MRRLVTHEAFLKAFYSLYFEEAILSGTSVYYQPISSATTFGARQAFHLGWSSLVT